MLNKHSRLLDSGIAGPWTTTLQSSAAGNSGTLQSRLEAEVRISLIPYQDRRVDQVQRLPASSLTLIKVSSLERLLPSLYHAPDSLRPCKAGLQMSARVLFWAWGPWAEPCLPWAEPLPSEGISASAGTEIPALALPCPRFCLFLAESIVSLLSFVTAIGCFKLCELDCHS